MNWYQNKTSLRGGHLTLEAIRLSKVQGLLRRPETPRNDW